ncbi:MAG: DmsC/YnfH family molybdoenzyme membrane anchor subunit [Melioribacteraceae bacterium]
MRNSEWSLVFFTIMVQMAAGCFISLGAAYNFFFLKNENEITHQLTSKLLFAISSFLLLALFISFMHLGSPKNAVYSLKNISSSWLSREILFVSLFTALTGFLSFTYYKGIFSAPVINFLFIITSLTGLLSIFPMARIYLIETVPAWNNVYTPIQFYLTAIILGIFSFALGLSLVSGGMKINIGEILEFERILKLVLIAGTILLAVQSIVWLLHIFSLSGTTLAGKMSFNLVFGEYAFLFYSRIVITLLSIIFLIYFLITLAKSASNPNMILIAFLLMLLSEILGRLLFYSIFARTGV